MKSRKAAQHKRAHAFHPHTRAAVADVLAREDADIYEAELSAKDADSVPEPLEDWADDDDANRWISEHREPGDE